MWESTVHEFLQESARSFRRQLPEVLNEFPETTPSPGLLRTIGLARITKVVIRSPAWLAAIRLLRPGGKSYSFGSGA
jgi:hypothetical protein